MQAQRAIVTDGFVASLIATVVIIFVSRLILTGLPLRRFATSVTVGESALITVGIAGLTFHCVAMFDRSTVEEIPGTMSASKAVNAMGTVSRLWFITRQLSD